jgi:hypothetical protein
VLFSVIVNLEYRGRRSIIKVFYPVFSFCFENGIAVFFVRLFSLVMYCGLLIPCISMPSLQS